MRRCSSSFRLILIWKHRIGKLLTNFSFFGSGAVASMWKRKESWRAIIFSLISVLVTFLRHVRKIEAMHSARSENGNSEQRAEAIATIQYGQIVVYAILLCHIYQCLCSCSPIDLWIAFGAAQRSKRNAQSTEFSGSERPKSSSHCDFSAPKFFDTNEPINFYISRISPATLTYTSTRQSAAAIVQLLFSPMRPYQKLNLLIINGFTSAAETVEACGKKADSRKVCHHELGRLSQ